MPAQPLLAAGSLRNEVLAVVDQQLDLPVDALVRPRPRQAGLPDRGAGDRERVDRVGLSARAACAAGSARISVYLTGSSDGVVTIAA